MIGVAFVGAMIFAAADLILGAATGGFPAAGDDRSRAVAASLAWTLVGLFVGPLLVVAAKASRGRPTIAGIIAACAAAPLAWRAGSTLLEGARVASSFAAAGPTAGPIVHSVARTIVGLAVAALFLLIAARAARPASFVTRALRGFLTLGCALGVHAAVLRGLYPAFHEVAIAVAWCGALEAGAGLRFAPRAGSAVLLALLIGGGGTWLLWSEPKTRGVAVRALPATGAVIEALGPFVPPPFGAPTAPPAPRVTPWPREVLVKSLDGLRKAGLPEKPSFLLVTVDAMRADRVGAIGGESGLTPRIDALAARGWTFTRAYAPASITFHTVASMMRGLSPDRTAALPHPDAVPRLAEMLGSLGLRTFASFPRDAVFFKREIGKDFTRPDLGFAEIDDDNRSDADRIENALGFLRREPEAPFFIWLHLMGPHAPYTPEDGPRFGSRPADLHRAEIFEADRRVGGLLDRLDELGALARTVVVVAADHGESFGERGTFFHGLNVYDEEVRVPLIVAAPGAAPTKIETATSLVDLMPTFLHLSGAAPPDVSDGRSLAPLATGDGDGSDRVAIVVHRHPAAGAAWRAAVRPPWKAILNERTGARDLYDLVRDPEERSPIETPSSGAADAVLRALDAPPEPIEDRSGDASRRRLSVAAAGARGRVDDPRWNAFLNDPSAVVRVAAIEALASLPGDVGGDLLRTFVLREGPASDAERMKALALANKHPRFEELESYDDRLRYAVAFAAARGREEPPYDLIRRRLAIEQNVNVRIELVAALDRAADPADEPIFESIARRDDFAGAWAAVALAKRRIGADGLKNPGKDVVDPSEVVMRVIDDLTLEVDVPALTPLALASGPPLVWAIFAVPGRDPKESEIFVRRGSSAWPARIHVVDVAATAAFRPTTESLTLVVVGAKTRPSFACALVLADR